MPRKSRRFFGLSTGSLPPDFSPRIYVLPWERARNRRTKASHHPSRLTAAEQTLIEKHLAFYLSLERGTRKPDTPAQRHFIAVCQGAARPTTAHEVAFVKWRTRRTKKG
jgi:uncharacterized protein YifE (UPF0438 family)